MDVRLLEKHSRVNEPQNTCLWLLLCGNFIIHVHYTNPLGHVPNVLLDLWNKHVKHITWTNKNYACT